MEHIVAVWLLIATDKHAPAYIMRLNGTYQSHAECLKGHDEHIRLNGQNGHGFCVVGRADMYPGWKFKP